MDPPVASINTERFTSHWEVIQTEANKLASGLECSGMLIYTAIYRIVCGGDVSYAVRLHWCIGKFFFAFCVKIRERIKGDDWVKEYANAFCIYEKTVKTIDLLSLHLNEAILENKECKNVRDLGYIIWERCILRQRYEGNLPSLSESLPSKREYAEVCLRSLSNINTNPNDRFEYYRNNYEAGLFSVIIEEFKHKVSIHMEMELASYLVKCSRAINEAIAAYSALLLPISLPILEETLEKVVFSKHTHIMREQMRIVLHKKNKQSIKSLCSAVRLLTKKVFPAFLECLKEFINAEWPSEKTCSAAISAYSRLSDLFLSDTCEKTREVLENVLALKIGRPGVGKELALYLESLIKTKHVEEVEKVNVLQNAISSKDEKDVFYSTYISRLAERIFSLQFDFEVEQEVASRLNMPWVLKNKVTKIFKDMVQSAEENQLFKQMYGAGDFQYLTPENNQVFFYSIITTACVWPIAEEAVQITRFPPELDGILSAFSGQYLAKHPRRRLIWADTLSTVEVEIMTNRVYTIEMTLTHYAVLCAVEKTPSTLDNIAEAVGLSTKFTANVLESFVRLSIVVVRNDIYCFNDSFSCEQEIITIKATETTERRIGNRKPYYQAWISRALKQLKECGLNSLSETLQNSHTNIFDWNKQEYLDALKNLNDRGLVEIVDATVKYLP
ncbi:hypothetical protein NERG_01854 [Nematocida ausubeli]|uniref:Cullin family profile domain-containing protein n=1 Tax=Nematocida ausubeli (strain ATCC PRA-371 / ERTm2) TaxID=1913371 RepID=H8ZE33_NEMA1|nr:hypothetical protein NERG_01854 [Nematocida ausubeli]